MHKAAFLSLIENVKTLLELGASSHYKDLIGLTPLYYNMITHESNIEIAELLLKEMAEVTIYDMQYNLPLHQVIITSKLIIFLGCKKWFNKTY